MHHPVYIDEVARIAYGRVPVVLVASEDLGRPLLSVYYDSYDAGYQAGEYFGRRGIGDIAYVASTKYNWARQRLDGITAALTSYGMRESDVEVLLYAEHHREVGQMAARAILSKRVPTAVICGNDLTASAFSKTAREMGFELGEDYALMGFDDEPDSTLLGITTFQPPLEQIGMEAARLATEAVTKGIASQKICLHSHLIERSSTLCLQSRRGVGASA
jgi:DNA-binding LacI/PurR family transcriptional regulator